MAGPSFTSGSGLDPVPQALALAEQDARQRRTQHQHQQSRIRHVVSERAMRALAERIQRDRRVLNDPEHGTGRRERQDHGDHR